MPSKDIIEVNKLKIGSSGATGIYVGSSESKYAVLTDSAASPTVIYDKVKYDFSVNDLTGTVPASGGTYNVTATSKKTHGNGSTGSVAYNPTQVVVPANTGSSYSSAVTITQNTSNLTDAYNFNVAADSVKSIALTISNPATIPAAGGSVSTCTTAATVTYHSGRVVTSFTPTSVNFNTVSASTKGTTVSDVTTAGTLTCYIVYGGVTSNTASVYVKQAANAVTSYTDYGTPTGKSISGSQVPAAGGTSTITWSGTPAQTRKPVYTSTSTGSTESFTPTISTAVTGNNAVATKGTTVSDVTTAQTVTGYYWANGKTASTTCYVTQAANAIVSYTDYGTPTGKSISGSQVPASGGTSTITWSGTPAQTRKPVYTSTATGSTVSYTPTISTAITGNNAVASKGTTVSNATTAQTVTGYYWANGKTASTTCYVTQAANAVTGYVDYQTPTGKSISGSQVPAKGGTSTITWSGTAAQNAKAVYTSNATASTYTNVAPSVSTAVTGNSAVSSKGTTISNATTAIATVTGYYWANGKTASTTCSVTQAANHVTGITVSGQAVSIDNIPAGGGSKTPSGGNGTVTYGFSSTSTSTTTPASSAGTLTSSVSYAMTATGRFTLKSTSTGEVSATTKGTTIENVTNANTLTKTVSYTWTPASGYDAAGTKTTSGSATCTPKQNGNYVSSLTVTTNPTISYGSAIPAGGGSITPTGAVGAVSYNFTSGSNSTTAPTSTYGALTTPTSYAMATGGDSRITLKSTSTGELSGTTKGTTVVGITSSGTVTKTVTYTWTPSSSYNGGGTITKAGTATAKGTQAANAVTGYVDYQTPTGKSISGTQVPAGGGTSTITWSGTAAQNAKAVYTSTATASTYTNVAPSVSTAVTGNSAVASKGTTASNATTALTVTGYYWANGKTASTSCYVTQAKNEITNSDYSKNNYAATVSIGNGLTAAGGSATVTYNASHYGYDYYSSGSYNNNHIHYDQAKVEITSNGNSRFSMTTVCGSTASNTTTLSHSTMGTSATTDSVTVKCTNMADTSKTATASKDVVNQIESTKYNEGNSAYTATISIGNGITAAGGSATVTASASHTHYWQQKYTSGSYVTSWYTSNVSDTANVTEDSDPNNRYSYSNGTLTHSNMTTNVATDSCTLRVRNASNTATTDTASVSVSNAEGTTEMNAGNSAWTATISIGSGINAGGGSATVTASASHVHYYRHQYTSGSYTGWYTPTVTDTADVTEDSDPNSRYSYASGTLTHSSMGTYVGTDSCTLRVRNHSNTATTNTTSVSVSNAEGTTEMNAGNSAWTATISIGNGITAAGGSATVTANASHVHYYRHQYTSGSYTGWYTPTVTDTADVTEDSDPNSRYSYASGTLTHSNMTTNATTDSCTLRVRNHSNTATTNTASVSVTNKIETTKYNEGNSAYTANISIGNGITAAGGSATVTASAGHTHYWQQKYTSGSYVSSWYTSSVTDTANVTEDSDPNNRYSYSNGTLTHSSMGTYVGTDSCTLRVRNASNTATTNTAAVSATNAEGTTEMNAGNSAWTATISIGNGITAGGGSATVTASAGHTHYYRHQYTSGSYTGWYTNAVSDTPTVTETEDTNNRFSYSNGTLSHSSMGTWTGTEYCTLKVTNANNTSTTSSTRTSVSNSEGTTEMNAGNSAWTATVSIGDGMTAAGGSATVSHSAGHTHYYRHQYTSGSYTGWYTSAVSDTSTISITSNGNSAFSLDGNTLSHSNMTTNARTDSVTITVKNSNNTSTTNTASKSITNAITNSNYDPQSYWASISIGSGISAGGGSATVTASAGHSARNLYTSGSYSGLGDRSDGVTVTEVSDPNSRYSYSNGTLSHSSMGKNETTDSCTLRATNNANSSATKDASTSVSNSATWHTEGYSGRTASVSVASGSITAGGGSVTLSTSSTRYYYGYYSYTSGSRTPDSGYQRGGQQTNQDGVTLSLTTNGNSRYTLNGLTLSHSSMGTDVTTDYWVVTAKNNNDSSATGTASGNVSNAVTNSNYDAQSYWASASIGSGLSAAGGSATVTASAGHKARNYYTSGSYSGLADRTDSATWEISSNGNNRFSKNGNTLSHSSMGTNATTDTVYVKATNSSNTSATGQTSTSIVNEVTNSNYDAQSYWASATIGGGLSAAGGSATVSASAGHQARYYYTSGSYTGLAARTDTATWTISSNGNSRFSQNGNTLNHSSMGTSETTDTVKVKATNSSNSSATGETSASVTNYRTRTDGNSGYTASITIGGGITAGGGSATVTASAGHTYWYYDSYTSGSRVPTSGANTSAQSDGVTVTEQSDNNNRYSYSNGTLTHSSMGTSETTDSCTLRATNNSSSSAYKDASVSVTNYRTRTDGNSGYTASISIGSGLHASGGSATVTASGSHTYWYYDSYTSGSRVPSSGANTSSQNDGASWVISSNGNNRFSKSNNTLSHSSMGTNETTDTVYVKATNSNNSSATAQTYASVTNSSTTSWGNITISSYSYSQASAAGGTVNPSTSASQSGTKTYTSGSQDTVSGSLSYSYSMTSGNGFSINTSSGSMSVENRGKSTSTRTSNVARLTVSGSGSKTATATTTCTQVGNTYTDSWAKPNISFYYGGMTAGAGTNNPYITVSQGGTRTWGNGAGTDTLTNSSFTYSYAKDRNVSGIALNTSTGVVTRTANQTTTSRFLVITVTVTGNGKSNTNSTNFMQDAGVPDLTLARDDGGQWGPCEDEWRYFLYEVNNIQDLGVDCASDIEWRAYVDNTVDFEGDLDEVSCQGDYVLISAAPTGYNIYSTSIHHGFLMLSSVCDGVTHTEYIRLVQSCRSDSCGGGPTPPGPQS